MGRFLWDVDTEGLESRTDTECFNRNEKKSTNKTEIKIFIEDSGTVRLVRVHPITKAKALTPESSAVL